ncbi:MAG TPA: DUF4129 domain-containing protein [Steroidobacteraceae bacterium]|nr:DUF4129 domain-containing protein [Steroidobacteraceae bacterium]
MRSRPERLLAALSLALITCSAPAWCAAPAVVPASSISDAEIDSAAEALARDPNLAEERTVRMLSFQRDQDEAPRKKQSWLKWLGELFAWLAVSVRWLFWLVIGLLLATLVYWIARMVLTSRRWEREAKAWAPTHVQSLDIRPESLPGDIGAAASALWRAGDERGCLSLLYRGLLSRLVHLHDVPIRDSSTEGDCLRLASASLSTSRTEYVLRLVRTWQQSVYGGQTPDVHEIEWLCAEFAAALDQPAQRRDGAALAAAGAA